MFLREYTRKFDVRLRRIALRKLTILDAAEVIDDLRIPPGNRLEKLSGDRSGQYSIRTMTNGEFAFYGGMEMLLMLKLLTTIRRG